MTRDELLGKFTALSEQEQIVLLTKWAAELTVAARGTYVVGSDQVKEPERLREFNELQHRVTGQLLHLVKHDNHRYPDEVFIDMVNEWTEVLGCRDWLTKSMETLAAHSAAP